MIRLLYIVLRLISSLNFIDKGEAIRERDKMPMNAQNFDVP